MRVAVSRAARRETPPGPCLPRGGGGIRRSRARRMPEGEASSSVRSRRSPYRPSATPPQGGRLNCKDKFQSAVLPGGNKDCKAFHRIKMCKHGS